MSLEELIKDYLNGKIDKIVFFEKIKVLFHGLLLNQDFLKYDNLLYYPFLSELMDEDCYNLNNFNELILDIKEILEGNKRYEYSLWVRIKYEKAGELYTIWEQIKKKNITKQNIDIMQNKINYYKDDHTIMYEYIRKLHGLLKDIAEYGVVISNSLYVESFSLECFIKETDRLLQLLLGKIPIYITIKYTEYGIQYICT